MLSAMSRIAFSLAIITALSACDTPGDSPQSARPPAAVKTLPLAPRKLEERIPALGTLLARESVLITSTVSEKVAALHFNEGEQVKRGDLLATLEQAEEQAQLRSARADLAEQEREVKRLQGLIASQVTARNEYDQRVSNRERAHARIAEVEAKIAERTLRAPFDGTTGLRNLSPGALVSAGDSITTLDDLSVMRMDLQVPSLLLSALSVGQKITAFSEALDREFSAEVTAINPRIDPVSRSVTVRARLDNPERLLKPGMLMRLSLLKEQREAIIIPEQALESAQDSHYVWLVNDEGKAEKRQVTPGFRRAGELEIVSGLNPGEQLITEGFLMLRPGSPVAIQEG
ncbi:MAG: efflux RND transporter periplasmic adaptor subunit [Spongiibacter sp.]|uniref:Efflux RND transporter periplasmic adaptor subunit n=1 Tax=Spongiibacter thalassae TaxID=2721624 RepID=A0ABX1GFX7_9GAMM|nr:efflux RND transporter periplasmic adaptor subunit [Spongiibacter thalassae]MDX1504305.1 efflux RND transporter periplasmic adaptor subunit [Spongiibacter sp.]NKI18115.1 efflux RND transporter periplasmic adaptor subunit [Spongiibacter thalassae]